MAGRRAAAATDRGGGRPEWLTRRSSDGQRRTATAGSMLSAGELGRNGPELTCSQEMAGEGQRSGGCGAAGRNGTALIPCHEMSNYYSLRPKGQYIYRYVVYSKRGKGVYTYLIV